MRSIVLALTLMSVAHAGVDIGIDTIGGIPGTIDSGQAIVPRPVLSTTTGGGPGDVFFQVIQQGAPAYSDSARFPNLAPGTRCTLVLASYVPEGRESLTAVVWLRCAGDTYPGNDTFALAFFVRIRDAAITEILVPPPDTTYDSGAVISPQCWARNFGNVPLSFDVNFRIGSYQSARNVSLLPGGGRVVMAPAPYIASPGIWACQVAAIVAGDKHPENNLLAGRFTVRGTILRDVEARAVLSPCLVIDTSTTFGPSGRVRNNGVDTARFESFFTIWNPSGVIVYQESADHVLGPRDSLDHTYSHTRLRIIGAYTAAESVYMAGDQVSTNDCVRMRFRVVAGLSGDIGIIRANWPRDTLDTFRFFSPWCVVKNFGPEPESGCVVLTFSDTAQERRVYADSVFFGLGGGEEVRLDFDSVRFRTLGLHQGQCRLWTVSGYADSSDWQFWVKSEPGVEERMKGERGRMNSGPTVVRGVLNLEAYSRQQTAYRADLLDAGGRKVLDLAPGPNDLRGLAPGVYFERGEGRIRKVVIGK